MKNSRFRRRVDLFTTCFLGLSALLLAVCILAAFVGRDSPDDTFLLGVKPVFVSTTAMEPTIKQHSIVFFRKTTLDTIGVGDVVLRKSGDNLVIRRVVRVDADGQLVTKPDNRSFEDSTTLNADNFIALFFG